MLDAEEIRWIKSTANELNNLLQMISESGEMLESHLKDDAEAQRFIAILRNGVARATDVTRGMATRVGGHDGVAAPAGVDHDAAPSQKSSPDSAGEPPILTGLPPIEIHNPTGPGELILIVDDEDFVTMLAKRVLSDEGYRVVTAKNGFQAIDIYRKLKEQISLVILDFTMPVMDGSDVFAELQIIEPKVPVVLSSGFAEQDRLRGMLAKGLRGFIPKPYTQQKLLTQVRQTLDALTVERRMG